MMEQKIKNLESEFGELKAALAGLASGFNSFTESTKSFMREQKDSVSAMREEMQRRGRPDYAVLIAAGALILAIIGLGMQGYIRDLNRVENNLEYIKRNRISAQDPVQNTRMDTVEAGLTRIEAWDEKHGKQCTETNSTQDEQLRALERKVFGAHTHE